LNIGLHHSDVLNSGMTWIDLYDGTHMSGKYGRGVMEHCPVDFTMDQWDAMVNRLVYKRCKAGLVPPEYLNMYKQSRKRSAYLKRAVERADRRADEMRKNMGVVLEVDTVEHALVERLKDLRQTVMEGQRSYMSDQFYDLAYFRHLAVKGQLTVEQWSDIKGIIGSNFFYPKEKAKLVKYLNTTKTHYAMLEHEYIFVNPNAFQRLKMLLGYSKWER
jgi:hypothetical protein